MESFYAPYVQGSDGLFEAISRMAAINSPALVIRNVEKHTLFTSKTVFESYSNDKEIKTCSQLVVEEGFRIEDISHFKLGPLTPFTLHTRNTLSDLLEDILKRKKLDYGFLYPEKEPYLAQLVQVITRREEKKFAIVGTNTICVCDSPGRHISYDPQKDGKDCIVDPPHKYKCTSSKLS